MIDIEKLLPWGPAREVLTQAGPRLVRNATPTDTFWTFWRRDRAELKRQGISVAENKKTGKWIAAWWSDIPAERKAEIAAAESACAAVAPTSRAVDADEDLPRPPGLQYRGYQRAGIAYVRDCFRRGVGAFIGDEPGLGKTIEAIGAVNCFPDIRKILIVCPNTLKRNWDRELRTWLMEPLRIGIQKAGNPWLGGICDVVIINPAILDRYDELPKTKWDLRIGDESHAFKNWDAIRTKAMFAIPARHKIHITGTPIENKPMDIFPLLCDLDPGTWNRKNWFFFGRRYCDGKQVEIRIRGGKKKKIWQFNGASNESELQAKLRGTILLRRKKFEVLAELPPKSRQIVELEGAGYGSAAQTKLQGFIEKAEDYEAAVAAMDKGADVDFESMARVRQQITAAKLPAAIEFIEDARENGKVIVFGHHVDYLKKLREKFPQAALIIGEVDERERQNEVDRFQEDPKCDVFLGNEAAAEGITLTASSHVIHFEMDWRPSKMVQREDRAHRLGQESVVMVSYLVMDGTYEVRMMQLCLEKMAMIDRVLDKREAGAQPPAPPKPEPMIAPQPPGPRPKYVARQITLDI